MELVRIDHNHNRNLYILSKIILYCFIPAVVREDGSFLYLLIYDACDQRFEITKELIEKSAY